jgi:hypothetical protein
VVLDGVFTNKITGVSSLSDNLRKSLNGKKAG